MLDILSLQNGQALVMAKRTFLEFKFCVYDKCDRLRRGSAPACVESPDTDKQKWISEASTTESCEFVFWTSEDCESLPDDALGEQSKCSNFEAEAFEHGHFDRLLRGPAPACIGSLDIDQQMFTSRTCTMESSDNVEALPDANAIGVQEDVIENESACVNTEGVARARAMFNMFPSKHGKALVRAKKTFLEFNFWADDDSDRRRVSAPAHAESLDAYREMWICETSAIESCEHVLWTSEDVESMPDANKSPLASAELGEECWNSEAEDQMWTSKYIDEMQRDRMRRSKTRPCRGKRLRLKKLVSRLCEAVDKDPEGFNTALIEWPPSLADEEGRVRVLDTLKARKAKAFENLVNKGETRKKVVPLQLNSLL